jgi:hypothetical protein
MDRPKLEVPSTHTGIGIIDGMTITLIVLASVLGALARVLAFALFDTPHASIHAILAPNLIGCFLMGILQSCKPRMVRTCFFIPTIYIVFSIILMFLIADCIFRAAIYRTDQRILWVAHLLLHMANCRRSRAVWFSIVSHGIPIRSQVRVD